MSEQLPNPHEALAEMQDLLSYSAVNDSPQRFAASRYTICRDVLMRSDLRSALPGFLTQCLTIARFHEFIHLLDPDPNVRLAFLDDAFRSGNARVRARPSYDSFGDADF